MAKVSSKYQIRLPRKIAEEHDIRPGDEIEWVPTGETIGVISQRKEHAVPDRESRLRSFDRATERNRKRRETGSGVKPRGRGWSREDLYRRGRSR